MELGMQRILLRLLLVFPLITYPLGAFAYVGPGLGAGALGVIIGVIVSVLLAIFAVVWYPLKRLMKRIRDRRPAGGGDTAKAGGQQQGDDQPVDRDRL
jgi:hypothetical protein